MKASSILGCAVPESTASRLREGGTAPSICELQLTNVCNFETISRRKIFLDVSSAEKCWDGLGAGKQHKWERRNCSAWRRESKGNLPAVCSYLTGYGVGYQGEEPLFSEMHSGRKGGQQMQDEHRKLKLSVWILFFLTVEWSNTGSEVQYWIRDHKNSILKLSQAVLE